jgi:hypothetical protein
MSDNGIGALPIMVMFTDADGIPKKAHLQYTEYPLNILKGKEIPLKDNAEITGNDYFVYKKPNRQDKYGKGLVTATSIEGVAKKV